MFLPAAGQAGGESGAGARLLPQQVGDFSGQVEQTPLIFAVNINPDDFAIKGSGMRSYKRADGEKFRVSVIKTRSSSAAYSLLRHFAGSPALSNSAAQGAPSRVGVVNGLGVLGTTTPGRVQFIKGDTLVDVEGTGEQTKREDELRAFAKLFAETIDGEAGVLPVLLLHLPDWEKKLKEDAALAVTLPALQAAAGNRPVLEVLAPDFEDGTTEAVTAKYGEARLVIVEFATPQHSVEGDARINERIAQLRAAGQPAPTQYKREGNYSVFVFDAADASAAEQLISGVKYEKDVRWLGRNPHADAIAARHYTQTMGSMLLTTLITAGGAILLCLGVGGVIGGVIFLRRRAQNTEREVFSDAGGMLRLELEELNSPSAPVKLIGRGED